MVADEVIDEVIEEDVVKQWVCEIEDIVTGTTLSLIHI